MKNRVLIIDDESAIRDLVRFTLEHAGYEVQEAIHTAQASCVIADFPPHLILLDWMLPGKTGAEFVRQLKSSSLTQDIPIIMLTARAEENYKIQALGDGADDYITKPFSPREMLARVQSVLRRGPLVSPEGVLRVEDLCLNLQQGRVRVRESVLSMSPLEFELLRFLMSHLNHVYSREQLLSYVWPGKWDVQDRTVDVHIKRLRKILQPYGYDRHLCTIRGQGYQFLGKLS